jgi:hypothetical protein
VSQFPWLPQNSYQTSISQYLIVQIAAGLEALELLRDLFVFVREARPRRSVEYHMLLSIDAQLAKSTTEQYRAGGIPEVEAARNKAKPPELKIGEALISRTAF